MRSTWAAGWKSAYDRPVSDKTTYFDGRTAARNEVTLQFEETGVRITGGDVDAFWPYDEIRCASQDRDDRPLTFRCQSSPVGASRLTVSDEAAIEALRTHCGDLDDRARRKTQSMHTTAWAAVGIVSLGLVIWGAVHLLPRLVAPLIPVAWEERVGEGVVDDIAHIFGTMTKGGGRRCETADGRLALDILVNRLIERIETPYRFQVIVLDVDMVNALAAPGGHIVVFKKLLTEAQSADEVAGVVAHEMGHVMYRHPTEAVARTIGLSFVFNILMGGLGSGAAGAAGQALLDSAYSRDAEREADSVALELLTQAQISSRGLADFLSRMAQREGDAAHALSFISSHPPSDERARAARDAIAANAEPALFDSNWQALKSICG